jgi:hypothetical protein
MEILHPLENTCYDYLGAALQEMKGDEPDVAQK